MCVCAGRVILHFVRHNDGFWLETHVNISFRFPSEVTGAPAFFTTWLQLRSVSSLIISLRQQHWFVFNCLCASHQWMCQALLPQHRRIGGGGSVICARYKHEASSCEGTLIDIIYYQLSHTHVKHLHSLIPQGRGITHTIKHASATVYSCA